MPPLSQRGEEGGRGGGSLSPSPDGPVQKKEARDAGSERQRGDVAALPGGSVILPGVGFCPCSRGFVVGFVRCCHQQEQLHLRCVGEGKGDHLLQAAGVLGLLREGVPA